MVSGSTDELCTLKTFAMERQEWYMVEINKRKEKDTNGFSQSL